MKKKYTKELVYYKKIVQEANDNLVEIDKKVAETNKILQKIYGLFDEIEEKINNES